MPAIPNRLHFITFLEPPTSVEAINIVEWANQNPEYSVNVWAPSVFTRQIALQLKETIEMSIANEEATLIAGNFGNYGITWWFYDDNLRIQVSSYDRLQRLIPDATLHELATQFNRKQICQTIGGMTVILNSGGIFINKSVKASGTSVPTDLRPPYDILFSSHPDEPAHLSGHIIAAHQRTEKLLDLAKIYTIGCESILVNAATRMENPYLEIERTEKLQAVKDYERYSLLDDSDEVLSTLSQARQEYHDFLTENSPAPLIDSEYIESWIDINERMTCKAYSVVGASPIAEYVRPARSILKKQATDRRFNFPHIVPQPPQNYDDYSFQRLTGILLRTFPTE